METPRCPTCSKPLEPTLPDRLIAQLDQARRLADLPMTTAHLARQVGKAKYLVRDALNRLEARGAVRRARLGSTPAWEIVPDLEMPELGIRPLVPAGRQADTVEGTTQLMAEAIDRLAVEIQELRVYKVPQALEYLAAEMELAETRDAQEILDLAVRAGKIDIHGESVSA